MFFLLLGLNESERSASDPEITYVFDSRLASSMFESDKESSDYTAGGLYSIVSPLIEIESLDINLLDFYGFLAQNWSPPRYEGLRAIIEDKGT